MPATTRANSDPSINVCDVQCDTVHGDNNKLLALAKIAKTFISKRLSQSAATYVLERHQNTHSKENIDMPKKKRNQKLPGHLQVIQYNNADDHNHDFDSKVPRFKKLLTNVFTLSELSQLSWAGVPMRLRPITWRLLSGYLPPNNHNRKIVLDSKRKEYHRMVLEYYNTDPNDANHGTYHQIHIDMPRMNPTIPLFQQELVQQMFERILFIWSIRHPASGYVQGVNDLVTPYFLVFLQELINDVHQPFETFHINELSQAERDMIEADSFWCASKLLDGIQDNYVSSQPGIQLKVRQLRELICRVDNVLHQHLLRYNIIYLQFSFRWFNNLLTRELPIRCIIRLWDTYLAEINEIASFQLYVCAAFLLHWREQLLKQTEFQNLMLLLQNLPTQNWSNADVGLLAAEAFRLKAMFEGAPNHLKFHDNN